MPAPGSYVQLAPFAATPSPPPVGSLLLYVVGTTIFLEDSSGNTYAFGSTTAITSLTGDVTAVGPGPAAATVQFVGGQSAAAVAAAAVAVAAATSANIASALALRDPSGNFAAGIITANLNGTATNATNATTAVNFSGSLVGDVTGTQGATVVSLVGGQSAAAVAAAAVAVAAATNSNIASTLVKRDASGNFAANVITASLTGNVTGNLTGNVTGNVSGSAGSFTGSLAGDVTGTQGATSVVAIQGITVNPTAPTDAQFLVYQTSITSYKAVSMSGGATMSDAGVVTLTNASVTGQLLTGYVAGVNTPIVSTNSILIAFQNLQAQISGSVGAAITSLTGDVTASGPGAAAATVVAIQGHSVSNVAPTNAQMFIWNNTTTKWVPVTISGDVSITAAGVVSIVATTNGTITTLSALSLPGSQVTGNISGNAGNITATSNSTLTTLTALALPATQLTGTLQAAQFPALLGDVTTTAGSLTTHLVATTNGTITTLSALSLPGSQVTGNISGNAANVTGVVAIANGGTGQTTPNAAFNALSPMTTLGDIIYMNATPVAARLPGNTTTAREFLTSQGTGTLANAPTWSGLVSGDIPNNAANTTGTAANITATSNATLTTLSALTSAPSLAISGSQVGGFTQGSVIFAGATGALTQDNANLFWNDTTLALGIGVQPATTAVVDIVNNSGTTKAVQVTGYGSNVGFRGREASGTLASPTATVSGATLTFLSGRGYGATAFAVASTGVVNIVAGATFTDTSMPTYIALQVTPVGSVTSAEAMRVAPTGNVLIGTTTDSGTQKLQVNGNSNVGTVTAGIWNGTIIGVAYGGTGLGTAPANGQLLIGNGTTYTLANLTPGTGISIANAAGAITISSTATTAFTTKTGAYTILSTDNTIFCDTSGGAFTLTLPSPTGLGGKRFLIVDSTGFFQTNNLTLAPSASEKIEGLAASKVLQTPWGWFNVTSDGTNWFVG